MEQIFLMAMLQRHKKLFEERGGLLLRKLDELRLEKAVEIVIDVLKDEIKRAEVAPAAFNFKRGDNVEQLDYVWMVEAPQQLYLAYSSDREAFAFVFEANFLECDQID